jgi:acyl-CoA thioesterase I
MSWVDRVKSSYAPRGVGLINIAQGATTTYSGLPVSSAPVAGRPGPHPNGNVDAAMAFSPRLVLVSYPTNDTAFGYSVDETVRNLLAIRAHAQERGAAVVVLSTQPSSMPASRRALLPQIDERVKAEVGPCFVPVREALAAPDGSLARAYDSGDGVHPNEAGHVVIHTRVASVIDSGACVRTQ